MDAPLTEEPGEKTAASYSRNRLAALPVTLTGGRRTPLMSRDLEATKGTENPCPLVLRGLLGRYLSGTRDGASSFTPLRVDVSENRSFRLTPSGSV